MHIFVSMVVFLALFAASAGSAQPIGFVKKVRGEVYISRPSATLKAEPNSKIHMGDVITTEEKSSAGLIFEDDMLLSLGPESEVKIESYLFDTAKEDLGFVARLMRGTLALISGQIVKLAPDNVRIETPDATLGARGTEFLVEVNDSLCK